MRHVKRMAVIAVAAAVGACATGQGGAPISSSDFFGDCNPLVTGGIGALLGAIAGGRKHRTEGAVVGAGIGALACIAYNYHTRQTMSAQQVSEEYKAQHKGTLPAEATVTRFDMHVTPASAVQAGNAVTIASDIEVVPGAKDPLSSLEQEITLFSPDGKKAGKARKPATQEGGGGGFETSFKMTMPQGVPQGVYPVKSQLYVNGRLAASTDANFQVVVAPGGVITAFIPSAAPAIE